MAAPTPPPATAPPKRSFALRVLSALGKLFALAGTIAFTFQFGARGLAAGLLFGFVVPWLIALRPKAPPRRDPFRRRGVRPLTWTPQIRFWPIVYGLLAGLGTIAVLQQFSIRAFTSALLIRGLIGGLLGGILVPSIIWWFAVKRINAILARSTVAAAPAAAALGLLVLVVLLSPTTAFAEVDGRCNAAIAGIDVGPLDSTNEDHAIAVHPGDQIGFAIAADVPAVGGEFRLHYGPLSVPLGEEHLEGGVVVGVAQVDDYDWMGGGLYRVTGEATLADGTTCGGGALIDVVLPDPLETVAGAAAATLAAAGALGIFGSALHDRVDSARAARRHRDALHAAGPGAAIAGAIPVSPGGATEAAGAGVAAGGASASAAAPGALPEPPVFPPPMPDARVEEVAAAGALAGAAVAGTRPPSSDEDEAKGTGGVTSGSGAYAMKGDAGGAETPGEGGARGAEGSDLPAGRADVPPELPEGRAEVSTVGLPEGQGEVSTVGLPEGQGAISAVGLPEGQGEVSTVGLPEGRGDISAVGLPEGQGEVSTVGLPEGQGEVSTVGLPEGQGEVSTVGLPEGRGDVSAATAGDGGVAGPEPREVPGSDPAAADDLAAARGPGGASSAGESPFGERGEGADGTSGTEAGGPDAGRPPGGAGVAGGTAAGQPAAPAGVGATGGDNPFTVGEEIGERVLDADAFEPVAAPIADDEEDEDDEGSDGNPGDAPAPPPREG